ncbi:MAG: DUF4292 domain-containing protein [Cyclobacteriaceae bacterium]
MNRLIAVLVLSSVLVSCTKRKLPTYQGKLIPHEIDFTEAAISSKLTFVPSKGKKVSVKSSLRMKKGHKIWCSASMLGFEGARVLITADSAKVLQKFPDKKYYPYSVADFSERFGLAISPFAMQDLLLGNKLVKQEAAQKEKLKKGKSAWLLEQKVEDVITLNTTISKELGKITELVITSDTSNQKLVVTYDNFKAVNEQVIPMKLTLLLWKNENKPEEVISLSFDHTKVNLKANDQSYPFKVSSRYQTIH